MSYNLEINQNADYTRTFTVLDASNTAINLTTYSIVSHIRRNHTSSDYYSFTMTITDSVHGKVSMYLPHSITSVMEGKYVYDIFLIDANLKRYNIGKGIISVNPNITKI